jgi:hypothetical protein
VNEAGAASTSGPVHRIVAEERIFVVVGERLLEQLHLRKVMTSAMAAARLVTVPAAT